MSYRFVLQEVDSQTEHLQVIINWVKSFFPIEDYKPYITITTVTKNRLSRNSD
jgi:hypothetical protein